MGINVVPLLCGQEEGDGRGSVEGPKGGYHVEYPQLSSRGGGGQN